MLFLPSALLLALPASLPGSSFAVTSPTTGAPARVVPAAGSPSTGPARSLEDPSDADLRRIWRGLSPEDRREIVQWFSAEVEYLQTFQNGLIKYVIERQPRPPRLWPESTGEIPVFDPEEHCPAQPIPRKPSSSKSTKRFRDQVLSGMAERKYETIWEYDWSTGMPTRSGELMDLDRIFENAVKGYHPQLDYAEALVEQMLDDGSLRKTHLAFTHAYADRLGKLVPDVTLYDVWASGLDMEMPDVECLGILHSVDGDWTTYRAPVPEAKHDELYARIGEHFGAIHQQRTLARTLARAYLSSDPAVARGWEPWVDRMHAFWEENTSDPEKVSKALPSTKRWADWMEKTSEEIDNSLEKWRGGQGRKTALAADRDRVRATLVFVMREYGVLER